MVCTGEFVLFRKYFKHDETGELIPTRFKIALNPEQYRKLISLKDEVYSAAPTLKCLTPCSYDHHNQMGFFQCPECCPNGNPYEDV